MQYDSLAIRNARSQACATQAKNIATFRQGGATNNTHAGRRSIARAFKLERCVRATFTRATVTGSSAESVPVDDNIHQGDATVALNRRWTLILCYDCVLLVFFSLKCLWILSYSYFYLLNFLTLVGYILCVINWKLLNCLLYVFSLWRACGRYLVFRARHGRAWKRLKTWFKIRIFNFDLELLAKWYWCIRYSSS